MPDSNAERASARRRFSRSFLKPLFDSSRSGPALLVLTAVALLIRMTAVFRAGYLPLAGDEGYYWKMATLLANGACFTDFFRPPLWSYALSIVPRLGLDSFAGRVFASFIGSLTPAGVFLIGDRVLGRKTGLVAGLLFALYPEHVGFSHGLWSEALFTLLLVASTATLFWEGDRLPARGLLFSSAALAGVALLSKEFTVIWFAGAAVTLVGTRSQPSAGALAIFGLIFLLPVAVYSTAGSKITGRLVLLSDAAFYNVNQAVGMSAVSGAAPPRSPHADYEQGVMERALSNMANRGVGGNVQAFCSNFSRLWAPNSFPVVRLLNADVPGWHYQADHPRFLAGLCIGFYLIIMPAGLIGLVAAPCGRFKVFSIATLAALSMTSVVAFLVSRFRLPFMMILILWAAYAAVEWRRVRASLRSSHRWIPLGGLLLIFGIVVLTQWSKIGDWG